MSSKYGINIELIKKANTPYNINTNYPIAIVGDDTTLEGISSYSNIDSALAAVGTGSVKNALEDLKASNIHTQIIISAFAISTDRTEQAAINLAIKAIKALENVEQTLKLKPKFIAAAEYNAKEVYEALKLTSTTLRAIYTIELNSTTESALKSELESISSPRAIITYQKLKRLDSTTRPASLFIIALYAKVLNSTEYGFAQSFSNRLIDGVIDIIDPVEYIVGSTCVADRLRGEGITLIISSNGLRAYGGETRDSDFPSLHSTVIFDAIVHSIFTAQQEAIDRQIKDVLGEVVDSLRAFYRRLIGHNVALGFEVSIPTDINTNETLSEGKVYIEHKVQEMPLLKTLTNKVYKVTSYSQELIKEIK